jgi:hypothetical protein
VSFPWVSLFHCFDVEAGVEVARKEVAGLAGGVCNLGLMPDPSFRESLLGGTGGIGETGAEVDEDSLGL